MVFLEVPYRRRLLCRCIGGVASDNTQMKLNLEQDVQSHRITAYGIGYVALGEKKLERSLILTPRSVLEDWDPQRAEEINAETMAALLELDAEVVLLGTGKQQQFPDAAVFAPLLARGLGVEVMDTAAACRTFNILAAEGRRVAAALLMIEK